METSQNSETGREKRLKNLKPFEKGHKKVGGKVLGQKNYATLRREALIEIGKANGKSPEEIEIMLHSKGIAEALKGDFRFYKDDLDRLHGQATENKDINLKGTISLGELFDKSKDGK